jgi:hypothetical protein
MINFLVQQQHCVPVSSFVPPNSWKHRIPSPSSNREMVLSLFMSPSNVEILKSKEDYINFIHRDERLCVIK